MAVIEVWGTRVAVRYGDGRLVTTPLRADDEAALDIGVAELARIALATTDDDQLAMLLFFRTAQVGADGTPTDRHPVPVFLDLGVRAQAQVLVRAVERDLIGLRRVFPPRPNLAPPPPIPGPNGPRRPDVSAAAARMRHAGNCLREIDILHTCARRDEYVLELAQAGHEGAPGLVAITTLRLLFVSAWAVYEFPVAVLTGAEVRAVPGQVVTLRVAGAGVELDFLDWEPEDFTRVAGALRLACEIEHVDGSIAPTLPSSADLFGEWQLLVERRKLGMVSDDPFRRQAVGIMLAMPG
ncbi:hypothetical protein FEK33_09250 [Nocardia asteroides NBRC 15531]|uniref:Uncharacterized protein n=1 Tax=Nocardia asteroides NBRC 15531 TaxID=1110697 RepID=U5E2Y6_NOCAS|nr:hypothetical protein [Nocardia asteroides]TLF70370.1 hypothetical protein FEK33_09250 [Nocardia asteroides NBRC 15531]UGT49904.1 hypothetical protein LT345_04725 [Nocardia asteroides]GAD81597.1 hypothetical protein NCAST_05_00310 [Nocardia asteroides NBRC 15531]